MNKNPAEGRLKIVLNKILLYIKKGDVLLNKRPVLYIICLANILNLLIEILARRSVFEGVSYLVTHPLVFEYNAAIIMLTLTFSLLFRRKEFMLCCISLVWLGLGIIDCVILSFRTTPLAFTDFTLFSSVKGIVDNYLSIWQIILIGIVFFTVIAGIVMLGIKSPKTKIRYGRALSCITAFALCVLLGTTFSLRANAVSSSFANLPDAYEEYGFAYCFSNSIVNTGIDRPQNYSKYKIGTILDAIGANNTSTSEKKTPNIIMIQLESFFDVNDLKGITYSENPIPNFSQLESDYSHGYLTVPAFGAGTANTEFEVLTGMSIDYFGAGEYPYKTVLQSTTCESMNYDLKELGYSCHAIHNHSGTFYDRNKVFASLGFDTFSSLEYMDNVMFTPRKWAKDSCLTDVVFKALNSTDTQDFIYTITVQGHGRYPGTPPTGWVPGITVSGIDNQEDRNAFEYYVNQIHETDEFIGELVSALSNYDEPVVLVLFGDHLPHFDITNKELANGDVFQTNYVIWSNYGLKKSDCNLFAYQLSANVMERLGFDNGILTKFHQKYSQEEDYLKDLELLEYDMLYGKRYAYNEATPYVATNLKMGISDIYISNLTCLGDSIYVRGEGFTKWSMVSIDGVGMDTVYINKNLLKVESANPPKQGSKFIVSQVGKDKEALSSTGEYIYW